MGENANDGGAGSEHSSMCSFSFVGGDGRVIIMRAKYMMSGCGLWQSYGHEGKMKGVVVG